MTGRRLNVAIPEAGRDRVDQKPNIRSPARVCQFHRIAISEILKVAWERVSRWHPGATHEHRNHRDISPQRGCDLQPHGIVVALEAPSPGGVARVEPSLAEEHQQHAAGGNAVVDGFPEVAPRFDRRDIHEDRVLAEMIGEVVEQASRLAFRILPSVADEDRAQVRLSCYFVEVTFSAATPITMRTA